MYKIYIYPDFSFQFTCLPVQIFKFHWKLLEKNFQNINAVWALIIILSLVLPISQAEAEPFLLIPDRTKTLTHSKPTEFKAEHFLLDTRRQREKRLSFLQTNKNLKNRVSSNSSNNVTLFLALSKWHSAPLIFYTYCQYEAKTIINNDNPPWELSRFFLFLF